jgi:autophagy-related protein 18
VALVGDADARLLRLYNAQTSRVLCELSFVTPVLSVLMNRRRLLVVLETRIHVYELPHVKLLHTIETALNPRALCVLASGGSCRVAYPQHGSDDDGSDMGGLKASSPPMSSAAASSAASAAAASAAVSAGTVVLFDALALQSVTLIRAHKGAIASLAINDSGSLLATASVRGTVIRVFALPAGTVSFALRRGTYAANIRCMAFAHDAPFLCAASQTGTVHVFRLGSPSDADQYLGNGIEVERASVDDQRGRRSPELLGAARSITGESPPAPPLISSYLSDMWQAASSALEPARHFAAIKLAPGIVPIACAFAPLGSRGAAVFVMSSDGLFFEFALDVTRGGDMIAVRQFNSDENDVVRQPVSTATRDSDLLM